MAPPDDVVATLCSCVADTTIAFGDWDPRLEKKEWSREVCLGGSGCVQALARSLLGTLEVDGIGDV